jgi:hypothetical protein
VQCNAAAASWQASAIAAVQQQPVFQLAASVIGACQQFINAARDKFSQAFPQLQDVDKQVIMAVIALQCAAPSAEASQQCCMPCTVLQTAAALLQSCFELTSTCSAQLQSHIALKFVEPPQPHSVVLSVYVAQCFLRVVQYRFNTISPQQLQAHFTNPAVTRSHQTGLY